VRWRGGLEIGHQPELGPLPEVRVLMCALGRLVPELRLNRLDGVTSGRGLAGHRMSTDLMVADLPEAEGSLHGPQRPRVGVDARGEVSVPAEQELRTRVSFLDVPANGVDHVLREGDSPHPPPSRSPLGPGRARPCTSTPGTGRRLGLLSALGFEVERLDRCVPLALATLSLALWGVAEVPGQRLFAGLSVHWAHSGVRITRYQMLCRIAAHPRPPLFRLSAAGRQRSFERQDACVDVNAGHQDGPRRGGQPLHLIYALHSLKRKSCGSTFCRTAR
jgi:hypothetical protein